MQPGRVRLALAAGIAAVCAILAPSATQAACKIQAIANFPVTMDGMSPMVTVKINGAPLQFMLDTGAFFSVINPETARRFKLPMQSTPGTMGGVGGTTGVGVATVKTFELAQVPIHNLEFVVPGAMPAGQDGVLGANVLGLADIEFDFANGVARIFKPEGCEKAMLAYWSPNGAVMMPLTHSARQSGSGDLNRELTATAQLNGKPITILFDTGAGRSALTAKAAQRVGVTAKSPGVVSRGTVSGFGSRLVNVFEAPFESLALGQETVRNIKLQFADIDLHDSDMLLGADFFLSHRVYVANSQGKVYLTYNGGPVSATTNHGPRPLRPPQDP